MSQGRFCKNPLSFLPTKPAVLVLLLRQSHCSPPPQLRCSPPPQLPCSPPLQLPCSSAPLLPLSPAAATSCSATAAAARLPPQASPFLKKIIDFPSYRRALLRLRRHRRRRARRRWIRTTTNNLKSHEADEPDEDWRCSKLNADEPDDDGKLKVVDLRAWTTTTTAPRGIRPRRRLLRCFSGGRPAPATPRLRCPVGRACSLGSSSGGYKFFSTAADHRQVLQPRKYFGHLSCKHELLTRPFKEMDSIFRENSSSTHVQKYMYRKSEYEITSIRRRRSSVGEQAAAAMALDRARGRLAAGKEQQRPGNCPTPAPEWVAAAGARKRRPARKRRRARGSDDRRGSGGGREEAAAGDLPNSRVGRPSAVEEQTDDAARLRADGAARLPVGGAGGQGAQVGSVSGWAFVSGCWRWQDGAARTSDGGRKKIGGVD